MLPHSRLQRYDQPNTPFQTVDKFKFFIEFYLNDWMEAKVYAITYLNTSDLHTRSGLGIRVKAAINSTPRTFPSTHRPTERLQILHKERLQGQRLCSWSRTLSSTPSYSHTHSWRDVAVKVNYVVVDCYCNLEKESVYYHSNTLVAVRSWPVLFAQEGV